MSRQFDVPKCKSGYEEQQLKMLNVFFFIFVANTKTIFGFNFVATIKFIRDNNKKFEQETKKEHVKKLIFSKTQTVHFH